MHLLKFLKQKITSLSYKSNSSLENKPSIQPSVVLGLLKNTKTAANNFDAKRMHDLALEQEQLSNKLKMLEYLSVFELYLYQHKANNYKMCEINEFRALKLSTQRSILESTKKVSYLSVA